MRILALLVLSFGILFAQSRVYVKGYYRSDGTYVKPHYRTAPDSNPYNNYSFPGNYNPNGKTTTGNKSTYLKTIKNSSSAAIPVTKTTIIIAQLHLMI